MPWIIQHAIYQINRYLVRSDGRNVWKGLQKAQKSPIVHFSERVLAYIQSQPPAQELQIRASPQKSYVLWLGRMSSLKCTSSISEVIRFSKPAQSLCWWEKSSPVSQSSSSSRLRLTSHLWTIRKPHMRELSFRILLRSSFFNKRTRSSLKLRGRIPMLFILQFSFQRQRLHRPRGDITIIFRQTFRVSEKFNFDSVQAHPGLPQTRPQQVKRITEKQATSEFEINMINSQGGCPRVQWELKQQR